MESLPETPKEKVVQIKPPSIHETRSLIIAMIGVGLVIGILAFSIGFIVGRINLAASGTQVPKEASPSAAHADWSLYIDEDALFYISNPAKWEAKKHAASDYEGVKINSQKGYVDLWLLVDQPYFLGEKHQKAIESEEEIKVTVGEREATGTQYNYKAGNFFMVLILPATETEPQVTFWVEADDAKTREETLKIVESFTFMN